jgi:hypothetical protein
MRYGIPVLALLAFFIGSTRAEAASCSSFSVIKSYDAASSTVEVEHRKGSVRKYFPRPEGGPTDTTKIPGSCRGKTKKATSFVVKSSGGRLTMTQVRSNFDGKMLNDADDSNWLPTKLGQLIEAQTLVVLVIRPGLGKDALLGITTVYLPITDDELAEIKRLESQAEDI